MHRRICHDHEYSAKHGEPDGVGPQRLHVEPKGAEDGRAGDLDVDAVLVVRQGNILDLVNDEALEAVVEYRQLERKKQAHISRLSFD